MRRLALLVGFSAFSAMAQSTFPLLPESARPGGKNKTEIDVGDLDDLRASKLGQTQGKVSGKGKNEGGDPFLSFQTRYRRNGEVNEFRGALLGSHFVGIGDEPPSVDGKLTLSRVEVDLRANVFQNGSEAIALGMMLPINSVSSSNADAPAGSEFGGFSIGLLGRAFEAFQYRLTYTNHKSSKLKLYDTHNEIGAGVYGEIRDASNPMAQVSVLLGPEAGYSLNPKDATVQYGLAWGGRVNISAETTLGSRSHFRFGLEALMRRIVGHRVFGVEQGGAGLLAVMPSAEWNVYQSLWLGVLLEVPVFRPAGNEAAFGQVGLPGLFGTSFGVTLRAATI